MIAPWDGFSNKFNTKDRTRESIPGSIRFTIENDGLTKEKEKWEQRWGHQFSNVNVWNGKSSNLFQGPPRRYFLSRPVTLWSTVKFSMYFLINAVDHRNLFSFRAPYFLGYLSAGAHRRSSRNSGWPVNRRLYEEKDGQPLYYSIDSQIPFHGH